MKLPGCLPPLGIVVAVVALFTVAVLLFVDGNRMFSPGPLKAASPSGVMRGGVDSHAALSTDCAACHTAPWSSEHMADRCLACHTDIQSEVLDPATLHGVLEQKNCRDCHVEHRGATASLTQVETLIVDHEQFRFSLLAHQTTAAQQPFRCIDCHTAKLTRFAPTTCENCHRHDQPDYMAIHVADFGAECRACHDGRDRFTQSRFDHNQLAYPLLGKHAVVSCTGCHTGVRDLAGFAQAPTACVDCHRKDNIHPITFGLDCAQCHNSEGWATEIFDHNLASFKLTGKHTQVPCADCHLNKVFQGTPQTCVGCHAKDDIHLGQFGTDCAACHTTDTWKRGPFDHTFPLDHGGQGVIACATCHTDPSNYKIYTCYTCHNPEDIKRLHSFAEMMETNITDCARCHPTGEKTMIMH